MKKRVFALLCALLMIVGVISGCSLSDIPVLKGTETDAPAETTAETEPETTAETEPETTPEALHLDTGVVRIQVDTTWTLIGEFTPTEAGNYAIFASVSYNNSKPRGIAIVFHDGTYDQNLAVNEEYETLSGSTVQKLQTSCFFQIAEPNENMRIRAYAKSSSLAGNDCQLYMRKLP